VNELVVQGVKPVTAAIYASPLNLTPQPSGSTSIRVPVPKADWDKRQGLVRDAQDLCEKARIAIRQVRYDGQKEIKKDLDGKIVGKEEARGETKNVCRFYYYYLSLRIRSAQW